MAVRALPREHATKSRAASRPQLRVVRGSKAARRRPVLLVVLAVVTVFGVTGMHASIGQDGLRAATLERRVQKETERLSLLRAQVAQLSTPKRIADEANRLGLVADPDPSFVGGSAPPQEQAAGRVQEDRDQSQHRQALDIP
jgi:cell division protein FtsL